MGEWGPNDAKFALLSHPLSLACLGFYPEDNLSSSNLLIVHLGLQGPSEDEITAKSICHFQK